MSAPPTAAQGARSADHRRAFRLGRTTLARRQGWKKVDIGDLLEGLHGDLGFRDVVDRVGEVLGVALKQGITLNQVVGFALTVSGAFFVFRGPL